jgi:hypothetical protein
MLFQNSVAIKLKAKISITETQKYNPAYNQSSLLEIALL